MKFSRTVAGVCFAYVLLLGVPLAAQQRPGSSFDRWDRNGDGRLTRDELPENVRGLFDRVDTDGNGSISREEDAAFRRRAPAAQTPAGRPLPDTVRAERDIPYAATEHPRQRLDLFVPKTPRQARVPLLVFIHGGGWRNGDKSAGAAQVLPYVASGEFAGASIGYRLTDVASWPAQMHDCKAAIRWLRAHAGEYGYDPDRIGVMGTSAGGHLVAMLGVSGDVAPLEGTLGEHAGTSSRVACVVDFFGPTNMLTMGDFNSQIDHDAPDSPESKLLGGPAKQHPDRAREASPMTYVSSNDPPFLILHGTADRVVPFDQSETFHAALRAAGVSATLLTIDGGGHGGFGGPEVDRRVRTFLERHLLGREGEVRDETLPAPRR